MTVEQLCEILRACCVKNDLTTYSKSDLIELFKRVALPLPQREYSGNSWREKLLTKRQKRKSTEQTNRIKINKLNSNVKRFCTIKDSVKTTPKISTTNTPIDSSNTNRLKPPIDSNNYTKKVLKLSLSNTTTKSELNKIVIEKKGAKVEVTKNDKKHVVATPEKAGKSLSSNNDKQSVSNGKHKRIVIDFSDSSTTSTKTPKLVNLKRSSQDEVCDLYSIIFSLIKQYNYIIQ
ncbi:hypothetical protein O3M35_003088 [Rhynocoris fuscipes]|uniref:Ashwin n=1 Tax=Rhynocoris fuscipes TaxID=488301 RepID=A0AAW1CNS9_9HEMI